MKDEPTYIGRILRVTGAKVLIEITRELPSASPIIDGRIHRIGQIGTFVKIVIGLYRLYAVVSMVGVSETMALQEEIAPVAGRRWMEAQLVGEIAGNLPFQRGVSISPTIDDEVHVVTEADLEQIYIESGAAPVHIGHHASSETLRATIDLQKFVTRHAGIFGSTGSGKSNAIAALLKAVASSGYSNAHILIFDLHGEYGTALSNEAEVLTIGSSVRPLTVPYWALPYEEFAWFFMDKKSSESLQDLYMRERIFEKKLESAKGMPGLDPDKVTLTADSPIPFDLKSLWYELDFAERATFKTNQCTPGEEELISKGDARGVASAKFKPPGLGSAAPFRNKAAIGIAPQLGRIAARLRDRRFSFLCDPGDYGLGGKDLDVLLSHWLSHGKPITIFDLGGMPVEVVDLVVAAVSRIVFEIGFWGRDLKGVGRQAPTLMIFEEAHGYLPSGPQSAFIQGFARKAVQRVVKEGRKYGVGALVVSQRPSELDETILSQCGTILALRLSNPQDQARIASVLPDSIAGIMDILPALRTGEAVIVGESLPIPSRVRFPRIEPRPKSDDPEVYKHWLGNPTSDADFGTAVRAWRTQDVTAYKSIKEGP